MTKEEKQMLLTDLCGRALYKTYLHTDRTSGEAVILCCVYFDDADGHADVIVNDGLSYEAEYVKPYLRPLSSMTDEEKKTFTKLKQMSVTVIIPNHATVFRPDYIVDLDDEGDGLNNLYDWLNANHFDYRGLIERGLALEAPEDMYKND